MDRNTSFDPASLFDLPSLSARRAWIEIIDYVIDYVTDAVALRKESVDRNWWVEGDRFFYYVALRKESVDRNLASWSAVLTELVALRKESVDRNSTEPASITEYTMSLSARRAWIEIH